VLLLPGLWRPLRIAVDLKLYRFISLLPRLPFRISIDFMFSELSTLDLRQLTLALTLSNDCFYFLNSFLTDFEKFELFGFAFE
jgi:hypothetical protein